MKPIKDAFLGSEALKCDSDAETKYRTHEDTVLHSGNIIRVHKMCGLITWIETIVVEKSNGKIHSDM